MTAFVALLRAVNVGGTGKLPMVELKRIAREIGLESATTYIASGNLVFTSTHGEAKVRAALEAAVAAYMARPVPVLIRSADEMAQVARANPFADAPGRRVLVTFLPEPPPGDALAEARGRDGERLALGAREIYVDYCGALAGRSKLRIPAAVPGTARNMNTVHKLAEMAKEMA